MNNQLILYYNLVVYHYVVNNLINLYNNLKDYLINHLVLIIIQQQQQQQIK
jgi:hypothetical protein